jgi:hypothetical protein
MDNLFEILVPLIFAAIYFFGNMFSGKSDEDASPDSQDRRRGAEDPEAVERQRRIQDEIRRKIAERRAEGEGGRSRPQQTAESPRQPDPQPASRTPDPASRRPAQEGAFSWDESDDIYANSMQKRLKQIEATKRQAEKLQKQASASSRKVSAFDTAESSRRSRRSGTRLSGPVRQVLTDPAAARTAFIYGEVLGPPISQRKSNPVPGLS